AVRNRTLGENADIERIAVSDDAGAAGARFAIGSDAVTAIGLRDEAVESRAEVGILLRSIDLEMAGRFVDLVLVGVWGDDLDIRVEQVRNAIARRYAVPRVRLKEHLEEFAKICAAHNSPFLFRNPKFQLLKVEG